MHAYLRGTLIRGVEGYRPIETLVAGDSLPTRFSGTARIEKIIRHTVTRDDRGRWPNGSRPVHIEAGALGENAPFRDLIVTNSQAMFLDGALTPVENLVNGRSITFDDDPIGIYTLDFFQIEFDAHDVIEAEGVLSESHCDQAMESCAPRLPVHAGNRLYARLRTAIAPYFDLEPALPVARQPEDAAAHLTGLHHTP